MDWDKLPASRWGLRQLGAVLLLGAYAAGRHLLAIAPAHPASLQPIGYLLALVAFVCFSVGGALLVHGHHLFDKVEIAERWRRLPPAEQRSEAAAQVKDKQQPCDLTTPNSFERSALLSEVVAQHVRTRSSSSDNQRVRC